MAKIVGAIATSHTPTIGFAFDKKKQDDPVWAPIFEAYRPIQQWLAQKKPDDAVTYLQTLLRVNPANSEANLLLASHYESTDNAYVQADMAQITPRVHGTVVDVLVPENWWVKAGQVLVRLDTRDYEVRLVETKAALTRARETGVEVLAYACRVSLHRDRT